MLKLLDSLLQEVCMHSLKIQKLLDIFRGGLQTTVPLVYPGCHNVTAYALRFLAVTHSDGML